MTQRTAPRPRRPAGRGVPPGLEFTTRPEEIDAATIARQPLWTDKRDDAGPFDIIGDVHGCAYELGPLLVKLGYNVAWSKIRANGRSTVTAPDGRKAVFLGRPRRPRPEFARRPAYCHEHGRGRHRLLCAGKPRSQAQPLAGRAEGHGRPWPAADIDQLDAGPRSSRRHYATFLDDLRSHFWLDGGQLAVAHAGMKER